MIASSTEFLVNKNLKNKQPFIVQQLAKINEEITLINQNDTLNITNNSED
jgi:hypothetical protein